MKVRCRPPSLQNGFSALTTPAPWVQRLPAPPASETTATAPVRQRVQARARDSVLAAAPACAVDDVAGPRRPRSCCCTGSRFCARPMRPLRRSARICSCCTRSKPFSSSSAARFCVVPPSCVSPRGSRRSNSVCTMPASSGSCAAGRAEVVQLGAARRRSSARGPCAAEPGTRQRVVARRHQRRRRRCSRSAQVPRSLMAKS